MVCLKQKASSQIVLSSKEIYFLSSLIKVRDNRGWLSLPKTGQRATFPESDGEGLAKLTKSRTYF